MGDSLIGFLNQQIQKTNRSQDQQQQATSITSSVSNAPTLYASNSLSHTTNNSSSVLRSLESQQIDPGRSQNTSQRFSAQECISSLGGLGISTTTNNTVVSGAASIAYGNDLQARGRNINSSSIRNRSESMLLQQQPPQGPSSTPFNTQSSRQINMSSSGTLLHICI